MATPATAPKHLSAASKRIYKSIVRDYALEGEAAALETLSAALTARDRCEVARARLEADGEFMVNRFGEVKVHPAVAVERDSRLAMVRCFRELSLDPDTAPEARMPRVGGGRS